MSDEKLGLGPLVTVTVDVIIPVYNASNTIDECVQSIMQQTFPFLGAEESFFQFNLEITICCHDDGSTDDSLEKLQRLKNTLEEEDQNPHEETSNGMPVRKMATTTATRSRPKLGTVYVRRMVVSSSNESRGAGAARNFATKLSNSTYLAMLDSDDTMMPTRIAEQVAYFEKRLTIVQRDRILLGCAFERQPVESTWHYTQWANLITDERRMLERFREVTVIQPTWMITRVRFEELGGYIDPEDFVLEVEKTRKDAEANVDSTHKNTHNTVDNHLELLSPKKSNDPVYRLVCDADTKETLRLAEDLRFFHAHLSYSINNRTSESISGSINPSVLNGDGIVKLLPDYCSAKTEQQQQDESNGSIKETLNGADDAVNSAISIDAATACSSSPATIFRPLLIYRHVPGQTQSSRTPRKLLLQLQAKAFEDLVLKQDPIWCPKPGGGGGGGGFAIWGAGRDGKDFFKALSSYGQSLVKCFVDVDDKKINVGHYYNKDLNVNLPIYHFSVLRRRQTQTLTTSSGSSNSPMTTKNGNKSTKQDECVLTRSCCSSTDNNRIGADKGSEKGGLQSAGDRSSLLTHDQEEHFGRICKSKQHVQNESYKQEHHNGGHEHDTSKNCKPTSNLVAINSHSQQGKHSHEGTENVPKSQGQTQKRQKKQQVKEDASKVRIGTNVLENQTKALSELPVVVCVAMYRTSGALERNVASIGRTEGVNLWHFS